jgi:hypothetical protein
MRERVYADVQILCIGSLSKYGKPFFCTQNMREFPNGTFLWYEMKIYLPNEIIFFYNACQKGFWG